MKNIVLISIVFFSIITLIILRSALYVLLFSENDLTVLVENFKGNETDEYKIANTLMIWVNENMKPMYKPPFICPLQPLSYFYRTTDAKIIFLVKCGACGEQSILFSEMAKIAGLESRIANNPGENHAWNEVKIGGNWIQLDTGARIINDTGYYERISSANVTGMNKNISYVYTENSDGKIIDITEKYTKTGKLVVVVKESGMALENVSIRLKSMADNKTYKSPLDAATCTTNSTGICEFNIGGNYYTIVTEKNSIIPLIVYRDENVTKLEEGEETIVFANPNKLAASTELILALEIIYLFLVVHFSMKMGSLIGDKLRKLIGSKHPQKRLSFGAD